MEYFKIEKPEVEDGFELCGRLFKQSEGKVAEIQQWVEAHAFESPYKYWDEIKYHTGVAGVSKHELWSLIKWRRRFGSRALTPIRALNSNYFSWNKELQGLEEFLHKVDLDMGGNLLAFGKDIDEKIKFRFITKGIMEEAIASSQLEGAHTTREVAKKMLREGRRPRTKDEQMILNNFNAMKLIEGDYKDKEVTVDLLLELHALLTKNTLKTIDEEGRFRKHGENIVVGDDDGTVYYTAPPIEFVNVELARFVEFMNGTLDGPFLHPLVKAILAHFWFAYLHPFTDGNGRMARLVFYWYLLKNGYWSFAYIPISRIIKGTPRQYGMAYVYSEQDDLDITYFVDYNVRKINLAIQDWNEYLRMKASENKKMNILARSKYSFNERQIQLLQYFHKNKDASTSWKTHMSMYQISKKTAILDLKDLESSGFLKSKKTGRSVHYYASAKINKLF